VHTPPGPDGDPRRVSGSRWTNPLLPVIPDALARTGEYSILGLARGADQAAVRERRRGFTVVLFGAATVIAVVYSLARYLASRLTGAPVSLRQLIPANVVATYAWALLAPPVMAVARRYPVWRSVPGRAKNVVVQITALVVFVAAHVALCAAGAILVDPGVHAGDYVVTYGQALLSLTALDCIVYCTLVAVHHAVIYYQVSKDRALRASQLEARLAQAQLQVLRMQLQPHFLFNTLHSISALMHKDVKRADSMVASLSDLLRMSLRNIGAQEVGLQSELEFLQAYVAIMTLRFGDRLTVTVQVNPDVRQARVPNLFLQPLVENALRHGFGDAPGAGTVAVTARREGDMLYCEVVDNGRGLKPTYREGIGLSSTRQRLAHLYGERHVFEIRNVPPPGTGVRVTMAIPFHLYERTPTER
jgi:signal transduction histidine kinase